MNRRLPTATIAFVLLVIATVVFYGRDRAGVIVSVIATDGVIAAIVLWSAHGYGCALSRLFGSAVGAVGRIALGLGAISLAVLGLGALGLLGYQVAWGLVAAGALLDIIRLFLDKPAARSSVEPLPSRWLWLIAAPFLGMALVCATVPPGVLWGDEPNGYDVTEYHLQVPREWFEAGRISNLDHNVYSYFPMNVEAQYLLAMKLTGGPWKGMYVAQLMHVAMCGLAAIAVYAALRNRSELGATAAGVAVATTPWLTLLAPVAYNEGGLLLFGTLAFTTALRAGNRRDIALAGIFAGLACGTKLTAVPMVLLATILAMLVVRTGGLRESLVRCGVFATCGLIAFAPWLLRHPSNPVFPQAQSLLGRGHFTPDQQKRWEEFHQPKQARAGAVLSQVVFDWRYGFVLIPMALVAIASTRSRDSMFLAALLLALLVVWLFFTHLQSRFMVLAIPVMALLIGCTSSQVLRECFALVVALAALSGLYRLNDKIADVDERALAATNWRAGVFQLAGIEDLSIFTPLSSGTPNGKHVVLVGEAQAFLYGVPMSRLHYRTVFDVDVRPDQSIVDAWKAVAPTDNAIIVIDPGALRRFHLTCHGIPIAPADVRTRDRSYVIGQ